MKVKHFLLLAGLAIGFSACKKTKSFDVEAQFKADTTAIRNYINTNNIPALKHNSGIFYQIIKPGSGTVQYSLSNRVSADYQGKILGGSVFDDSKGTPAEFALGGVITGWQIGIPLIQKGGEIRLFIPSYYGYGTRGAGSIPANAILEFRVILADVK